MISSMYSVQQKELVLWTRELPTRITKIVIKNSIVGFDIGGTKCANEGYQVVPAALQENIEKTFLGAK